MTKSKEFYKAHEKVKARYGLVGMIYILTNERFMSMIDNHT